MNILKGYFCQIKKYFAAFNLFERRNIKKMNFKTQKPSVCVYFLLTSVTSK